MSDSLENIPLRDICKEAERLSRELIDHLENNLIPQMRELHELVKPDSPSNTSAEPLKDVTVRSQASSLLDSQRFMDDLYQTARRYFEAIDSGVADIVTAGNLRTEST